MKVRHEVTVGAMTIIGIIFMILGYNYLKGNEIFSRNNTYKINFENTNGLFTANSVVINGMEIGRVKDIQLAKEPQYQVIVTISLPRDIAVPEDSEFTIANLDLLGKKGIDLVLGKSSQLANATTIYQGKVPTDIFAAISEQLNPISEKADKLLGSLDTMISDVHTAIGKGENSALKQTMDHISSSLANANKVLAEVSSVFEGQKGSIESIIQNADGVMFNVNEITKKIADNNESIDSILNNFNTLSGKLAQADVESVVASAKNTLEEINTLLASINEGQGTLGKIAKDENLYASIDSTINSLNALLIDFKKHPKRYVSFSLIERKNKD